MNQYLLTRDPAERFTHGVLTPNGVPFFTLELPWRNNEHRVSCIPIGIYLVEYMAESESGEVKDAYRITNVPDREGILIHRGNTVHDSKGCLLIGMGWNMSEERLNDSGRAMDKLHEITGRKSFELNIVWYQPEEIKAV